MPIIILLSAIVLLLLMITVLKLNAFVALIVSSLYVGIGNGLNLQKTIASLTTGIGSTLGSIILVLGFGVMLGGILTETGAAQKISSELIRLFGPKRAKVAIHITAFVVGIALFYNAGFIVLIPLAFSIAISTGQSLVYLAIAMASALSVTHGFLPPHPGPTAIAVIFKADIGKTLIYGIIVAIPALFAAGIIFPEFIKTIKSNPPAGMFKAQAIESGKLPGFGVSLFSALIPIILMGISTFSELLHLNHGNSFVQIIKFLGDPGIAMLIAVLSALILLGPLRGISIKTLLENTSSSLNAVATIILVIAAGGAFKQVLIDSGTGTVISQYFTGTSLSPLFLGWLIATLIRIALGSATVAGLTAAGIVQPLVVASHVSPELMVISIGAGSLMCSHVNDSGFWMFKEYMGLSLADTFRSWSLMETIIGVIGLIGVLMINSFV
jgi:gluconate transporter